MWKSPFLSITLTTLFRFSKGCQIQGTDSGQCTYRYLPETHKNETVKEKQARKIAQSLWACDDGDNCMHYCGKYIAAYYPVCVPQASFFSRDQNFPQGRFLSHTVREKDRWVEENVLAMIEERISIETNKTARKLGVDEFGSKGRTKVRFHKNKACQESYKKFACWLNFPRCDGDESLPMCQSVCENFFRVCGYEKGFWMCDDLIDNADISASVKRDPSHIFPGAPFKANEYRRRKEPLEVCTPSIKGKANIAHSSLLSVVCSIVVCICLLSF